MKITVLPVRAVAIRYLAIATAFVAAMVMAGCATKPDNTDAVPLRTVAEREALLQAFDSWRALGSIAIDSTEKGKYNASFAWDTDGQGVDIKLFGPLGVQAFHLQEDAQGAQLTDRSGSVSGNSAEELLQAAVGSTVPIGKMRNWAIGLPGDATQIERDQFNRISKMMVSQGDDADWQVSFERYAVFDNLFLPRSVSISGDDVTIDLSFKKWSRPHAIDEGAVDEEVVDEEVVDDGRLTIPGLGS